MLDHIGFSVSNLKVSRAFYEKALKPLGIKAAHGSHAGNDWHRRQSCGLRRRTGHFFWIGTGNKPSPGMHVAFLAQSRKIVDEFYAAAIAAGGKDNGKPGHAAALS